MTDWWLSVGGRQETLNAVDPHERQRAGGVSGLVVPPPRSAAYVCVELGEFPPAATCRIYPLISLARRVRELEDAPSNIEGVQALQVPADADDEVRELTEALLRYSQRLAHFLERERQFTRDASHELRSPLTVIRMAASILLEEPDLGEAKRRTTQRIQRACFDMEELTEAFLLLARESETGLPVEAIYVNDIVSEELERAKSLVTDKPVAATVRGTHRLFLDAPEKVLSILLGNLLRNAFPTPMRVRWSWRSVRARSASATRASEWRREDRRNVSPLRARRRQSAKRPRRRPHDRAAAIRWLRLADQYRERARRGHHRDDRISQLPIPLSQKTLGRSCGPTLPCWEISLGKPRHWRNHHDELRQRALAAVLLGIAREHIEHGATRQREVLYLDGHHRFVPAGVTYTS